MTLIIPGIDAQNRRIGVQPQNVSGSVGTGHGSWEGDEGGWGSMRCVKSHVKPGLCQTYVSQEGDPRASTFWVWRKKVGCWLINHTRYFTL